MSYADELATALAEIGRHYQIDDLRLNHARMATFALSDGLTVTIEYVPEPHPRGFLIVELADIHESVFEAVATALLAINGRWLDTAGASFALHPGSDNVLAILPVPPAVLSAGALPRLLDRFLATCRTWADKVRRGEADFSIRDDIEAELEGMAND
ncbi:type III secretion system chaperone [Peristeroidobacter soli]|uniref:type III secretion system chaperone n=1 Tax=Peristeroidobacter soli TaxID=2497877 RepID=UPI00101DD37B|nr:type III secretion system chaperone [Peristeroidobacter soli]